MTPPAPSTFQQFSDYVVLGNPVRAWAIALVAALVSLVALNLARTLIAARARRWAERTSAAPGVIDLVFRVIARTSIVVVVALAVWLGAQWLVLGARSLAFVRGVVVVALGVQAIIWGKVVLEFLLDSFVRSRQNGVGTPDPALQTSMGVVRFLALFSLYAIIVLFTLDNLGIDVTAMITGLGIGGIAVALAVQNILGDLFGSLTIVLDKPFVVGDFIIVGDKLGTVERIGLKTTRVRALSGEQLVFANTDLLTSRVQNFKRMFERRVVFGLNVVHQTTPEQLELAARIIREAIEAQPKARFDRAHFKGFGPSYFEFEAVYYVLAPDFNVYMDAQQQINLHIVRAFERNGIRLAYPAQSLVIQRQPAQPS